MDKEAVLNIIKERFEIDHTEQDSVITDLINDAESQFRIITGAPEVKDLYEFIIKDVVSVRYNRIGSYGLSSESQGDYSVSFRDPAKDFEVYYDLLDKEYNFLTGYRRGRVYFL